GPPRRGAGPRRGVRRGRRGHRRADRPRRARSTARRSPAVGAVAGGRAGAQDRHGRAAGMTARAPMLFPGFSAANIETPRGRVHARVGGSGPPLLLLHGYPQTHVMWHAVAPLLANSFAVVVA